MEEKTKSYPNSVILVPKRRPISPIPSQSRRNQKIHHGRNIKRFREMMGIKQEALAHELGADWSQKKISLLEQKKEVEEELLRQVGEILRIPVEAFQNLDEEQAINIISSTFHHTQGLVNYNLLSKQSHRQTDSASRRENLSL